MLSTNYMDRLAFLVALCALAFNIWTHSAKDGEGLDQDSPLINLLLVGLLPTPS